MCVKANASCYTCLNISLQVELETTNLLKLEKSLKRHFIFVMSTTNQLEFKFSDIFICLPYGIRTILGSGLQIVLLSFVLICLMYLIVKLLMFHITRCLKLPTKLMAKMVD